MHDIDIPSFLSKAMYWWRSSLATLVPRRVRSLLASDLVMIVLEPLDGQWSMRVDPLLPWVGRLVRAREGVGADLPLVIEEMTRITRPLGPLASVIVRLPEQFYLFRTVTVPVADWHRIRAVALLDAERTTPFTLERMYIGHGEASQMNAHFLRVPQVVIKKSYAEPVLDELQNAGLRVAALSPQSSDPQVSSVNVLEGLPAISRSKTPARLVMAAAAVAAILLVASIGRVIHDQSEHLAVLSQQIAKASTGAAKTRAHESILAARVELLRLPAHRKATAIPPNEVWLELTKRLPDSTWLDSLTMNAGTVEIGGTSAAANELIEILSGSTTFSAVSFSAPLVREPAAGRERFRMRLELAKPTGDSAGRAHEARQETRR